MTSSNRKWMSDILLSLISCVVMVNAFSTNPQFGKSACLYLFPSGHEAEPQSTTSPFTLTVSADNYDPGGSLTVTLSSDSSSTPFRGFIIQARSVADVAQKVGDFIPTEDAMMNCEVEGWGGKTITHTDSAPKFSQTVTWTAPQQPAGDIHFRATVVADMITFWVNITSDIVRGAHLADGPGHVMSTDEQKSQTTPASSAPQQPSVPSVDLSGCGVTKSCYREPENCAENCDYILTWKRSEANIVRFELQGSVTDEQQYVAIAFSHDTRMGADSVIDCIHVGDDASFVIQQSYNVLNAEHNEAINDPMKGLEQNSMVGSLGDGRLTCHFARQIDVTSGNGDDSKIFQLDEDYQLLIAKGPVSQGLKRYHGASKIASQDAVNVASGQLVNIGGGTGFPLIKVHGILMILAWMICASFAILMPRYYKKAWPGSKCGGKDLWFQLHQSLMLASLGLTLCGFIIIFIQVGGYANYEDLPSKAHPPLGIATTVLVIVNPIMAAFRPNPSSSKRPIFNIFHFGVGLVAHVLSVATMYVGISMAKAAMPAWSVKIMGAYVVWHIVVEIILAVHKHCCVKSEATTTYVMKQLGDKDPMTNATEPDKANRLQTIIAVIHLTGVLALSLALIIPLATS